MRTISLLFAVSVLIVTAQADSLKQQILTMNQKVAASLMHPDLKEFEKLTRAGCTKNFVYSENGQNQTYDQMLKQMKQSMGMMKVTDSKSVLVKLEEHGSTATAVMNHTMKGVTKGQDKKKHVMVVTGKSTDTYIKVGNTWKMSKMAWTGGTMTMDGKPMNMSGGAGR